MNSKIEKLVIGGIEIPVNQADDAIFEVAETADTIERAEVFDYVSSTSSSYTMPAEGMPSKPLNAGAIRLVNSVLVARVPESAIKRDANGDF